jgi:hypothetical protein
VVRAWVLAAVEAVVAMEVVDRSLVEEAWTYAVGLPCRVIALAGRMVEWLCRWMPGLPEERFAVEEETGPVVAAQNRTVKARLVPAAAVLAMAQHRIDLLAAPCPVGTVVQAVRSVVFLDRDGPPVVLGPAASALVSEAAVVVLDPHQECSSDSLALAERGPEVEEEWEVVSVVARAVAVGSRVAQ